MVLDFNLLSLLKRLQALLLAKYLSYSQINLKLTKHQIVGLGIIAIPILLILMQPDAGSAMIFVSLIFVLNREGLPSWYFFFRNYCHSIVFFIISYSTLYLVAIILQ